MDPKAANFGAFLIALGVLGFSVAIMERLNIRGAWAIGGLLLLGMILYRDPTLSSINSFFDSVFQQNNTNRVGGFHEG